MRLIDADALIAEYDRVHIGAPGGARKLMQNAPTVDAVEVVHGRFTNVQGLGDGTCVGFCSNCMTPHKANNLTALRIDYRYCRWCGAKMDGDTNE